MQFVLKALITAFVVITVAIPGMAYLFSNGREYFLSVSNFIMPWIPVGARLPLMVAIAAFGVLMVKSLIPSGKE